MRQWDKEPIRQLAYLVEDLERSLHHWTQFTGVGPWTVYRNTSLQGLYRGLATTVKMHVALSYQSRMQIELIQPLSRSPSPYQHEDGRIRVGMHHIAWISEDIDRDTALAQQRGLAPVFLASNGAVPLAVPLSALSAEQGQTFVWVIDPSEHTVQRRPVRVGTYGDDRVPVLEGLSASDWVVAAGVQILREGLKVRPVDRDNRNVELAAKE